MNYMDEQAIPQIYIIPRNSTCTSFFLFCVFDWTPCLQHSWPQLRRVKVNLSPKEFSRINSWPFREKKRKEKKWPYLFLGKVLSAPATVPDPGLLITYLPTYLPSVALFLKSNNLRLHWFEKEMRPYGVNSSKARIHILVQTSMVARLSWSCSVGSFWMCLSWKETKHIKTTGI